MGFSSGMTGTTTSTSVVAAASVLSAVAGALVMWGVMRTYSSSTTRRRNDEAKNLYNELQHEKRARLPSLVILVRHGHSEANEDRKLYQTKPDNLVNLTVKGLVQAEEAGRRIEKIFQDYEDCNEKKIERVHLVVSPFERSLQTARALRSSIEHRIVRTDIQPRIREQEFGNIQNEKFDELRALQRKTGRFWFRFPTGESGSDVYDRVKSWWFESVLPVNERVGFEHVDALVVVTHGLTMRFVLMQLYSWSPTTFHSIWNAGNCDVYVLKKDLMKPGPSPYVLDDQLGDTPKSSIDLLIEFGKSPGRQTPFRLEDYLDIPPPRTTRLDIVKQKLAEQYPSIDVDDIQNILFMPFMDGVVVQGRTTSGVSRGNLEDDPLDGIIGKHSSFHHFHHDEAHADEEDDELFFQQQSAAFRRQKHVQPEASCRFPNVSSSSIMSEM